MADMEHTYIAIDLKSFYASVECVERNLDPLTTNLVVADSGRTEKTICLAVSPSLKSMGIPGRCRLFEVVQKVKEENALRRQKAPGHVFTGKSSDSRELAEKPELAIDYITAPPRMALYMDYSTRAYQIYLKYVAPEDIHVYSVDEIFMDVTLYLKFYGLTARQLAAEIIRDVLKNTGVTATAGIGPNLYICKVAMDIVAKHVPADRDGVRIAELDEMSYRRLLWDHRPLTDFWRVGQGSARKLESCGLHAMGDIARCSLGDEKDFHNEELLYRLFGVNAELLIDHAWGWEPCTMADIKSYRPAAESLGSGQVLQRPYSFEEARLIVWEMTDQLVLDLVDKGLVTDQIVLTIGYDRASLEDPEIRRQYKGKVRKDHYGRMVPVHARGTAGLGKRTSSAKQILEAVTGLYDRIADRRLLVRRVNVTAGHVLEKHLAEAETAEEGEQISLFSESGTEAREKEKQELAEEEKVQHTLLDIRKKFGKNAVVKGADLEESATAMERNRQIGGHKA